MVAALLLMGQTEAQRFASRPAQPELSGGSEKKMPNPINGKGYYAHRLLVHTLYIPTSKYLRKFYKKYDIYS